MLWSTLTSVLLSRLLWRRILQLIGPISLFHLYRKDENQPDFYLCTNTFQSSRARSERTNLSPRWIYWTQQIIWPEMFNFNKNTTRKIDSNTFIYLLFFWQRFPMFILLVCFTNLLKELTTTTGNWSCLTSPPPFIKLRFPLDRQRSCQRMNQQNVIKCQTHIVCNE